ncbi:MAG TPA: adenylate/guanylate cyclase domain-containing protein [Candidatus Limnocylindria bacterium]|nr:adenylate/guanylate cyclase domain-containing protein [Candidatus Limnocylindria bacterium]
METVPDSEVGQRARAALDHHRWREAYELLAEADARQALTAPELSLLADAAWWIGQLPAAIEAHERAYGAAIRTGDTPTAIDAALSLARENLLRNAHSVASGWLNRAERLLSALPEGPGHGWLAAARSFFSSVNGESDAALREAERAHEIGVRFGDRDLEVFGLSEKGAALLARGEIQAGLAAVDEATVAAVSGEIDPATAGGVCCTTIESCAALGDWQRAAEWTEAQDRWARREGLNGYPGMCRLFRSDVKRLRGAWLEAESEARRASDELLGYIPAAVGQAFYQIGQIRLLRGDRAAAEEALLRGHAYGRDPEPTMSLLRLAEGNVQAAHDGIRRALANPVRAPAWGTPSDSDLYRLALLPAQVEIAIAAHDLAAAREATDDLTRISEKFGLLATRASAAAARGATLLAEGDPRGAGNELRRASQLWTELDAPYEAARARLLLGQALAADGATDAAGLEIVTARETFDGLGAAPDVRRANDALAELPAGTRAAAGQPHARVTRAFVFTDIVDSTRLVEQLGDDAWNAQLRWHDDLVRSVAAEFGGEEIKRTGDGFFLAFPDADAAVRAAIRIQRRLAEPAPERTGQPQLGVRIGLHWAEATRSGLDYIGSGVNQAARIAMSASGGEILASAATLAATRNKPPTGAPRTVQLRGISAPVDLVAIDWR